MKPVLLWAGAMCLAAVAVPVGAKTCDELKAEIEERIQANGVPHFALQVVDAQAAEGLKVVGSCAGGAKKIIYMRP